MALQMQYQYGADITGIILNVLRERYIAHEISADEYASLCEDAKLLERQYSRV